MITDETGSRTQTPASDPAPGPAGGLADGPAAGPAHGNFAGKDLAASDRRSPRLVSLLACAGVLPFAAGALYLIVPFGPGYFYPLAATALGWWAVIILSFMAGSFWGMAVAGQVDPVLLIGSNIAAILGWAALIALPSPWIPVAITALFALLLLLDWRAWATGQVPLFYLRLRMAITSAAVLCLSVLVMAQ